jgi:carbon-monoxide dehydrogenase medium subunit
MLPELEEYHRPTSLNVALGLLARDTIHTVPLAGGTTLVPSGDPSVRAVVDLSALNLASIDWQSRPIRLGAMTTLQTLESDPGSLSYASGILVGAARACATRNVRNVATIGGTAVSGGPTCDLLVAFMALSARVTVRTAHLRDIPLEEFLGAPRDFLESGIITNLSLPAFTTPTGAALVRVARTLNDAAIVNAAALIVHEGQVCTRVRIAIGGAGTRPIRAASIESQLEGHAWDEARMARAVEQSVASLAPPDDFRASSEYRREMAVVVSQRALTQAWAYAQGTS